MSVLKSINFDEIKFDVLCIETERAFRPDGYAEEVRAFVEKKGYLFVADLKRNSWFVHPDFQWSRWPLIDPQYAFPQPSLSPLNRT